MTLNPVIRRLLAVHEAFRKLGFPAADLYVEVYQNAVQFICKKGTERFTVDIARGDLKPEVIRAEWILAVEWWNSNATTDAERAAVYADLWLVGSPVQLCAALTARGFIKNDVRLPSSKEYQS